MQKVLTGSEKGTLLTFIVSLDIALLAYFVLLNLHPPSRHSKKGKKTRQTEQEVGRQHREMDRPGVR